MDQTALRLLIQGKLDKGRLLHDVIPRIWGGYGNGETCDACDEIVSGNQYILEGSYLGGERGSVQFHAECFYLWDSMRAAPGR